MLPKIQQKKGYIQEKKEDEERKKEQSLFLSFVLVQLLKIAHETNKNIRSFELISIADFTIIIPYFDTVSHTTDDK